MITKRAARTVIVDDQNNLAIISVNNGEYFKIPGGAIEPGESDEDAAIREAKEESGCDIKLIKKVGEHQFEDSNPKYGDTIHQSVCFLAKKVGDQQPTSFDSWEQQNQMKLIWMNFDQTIKNFSEASPKTFFASEINKRDLQFILTAKEELRTQNFS